MGRKYLKAFQNGSYLKSLRASALTIFKFFMIDDNDILICITEFNTSNNLSHVFYLLIL